MTWLIACVRGGYGPRSKSGHCRCEACKAHYAKKAKERSERPQKKTRCKNGNISERGKYGHCLCKTCVSQRRERSKSYSAKWAMENPEKRQKSIQRWRDNNPEKVAEMSAKAGRKWSQNNKARRLLICRTREISKINRTPPWVNREELEFFYQEAQRLTLDTGVPHEVDHIVPLQGEIVSGLHVPWNLQVLTRTENRRKQNSFGGGGWERG